MQGNDLDTSVAARNAVTLIPTLFIPPAKRRFHKPRLEDYNINLGMLSWMLNHSYLHSEAFEVWSFDSDPFADELSEIVEDYASRCTSSYERFATEQAAQFALVNDRGIRTVYDADHERNDRAWGLRGYRVALGSRP